MTDKTMIGTEDAMGYLEEKGYGNMTRPTIINWIKKYELGKKVGGRWRIDKEKLRQFVEKTPEKQ